MPHVEPIQRCALPAREATKVHPKIYQRLVGPLHEGKIKGLIATVIIPKVSSPVIDISPQGTGGAVPLWENRQDG
jgi:hypothetical protein